MRTFARFLAWTVPAVFLGLACGISDSVIFQLPTDGDSIQFTHAPGDSIITTVDTTLTNADTVVVIRIDTVFQPPDTVLIQRVDTTVSGTDTIISLVTDTIVTIDTLIVTSTDTVVVYDTVFVVDTVTVPSSVLSLGVSSLTLDVGRTATLSATLTNGLGFPVPTGTLTWISSVPSVASVNASGTVTGVAPGQASVYAFTTGGTSAGVGVTVRDTATTPVASGTFRRNRPAGLTVISDYGFDDAVQVRTGFWTQPLGSSGWTALYWGSGGEIKRTVDLTSAYSPGFVMEEVYAAHLSGGGPSAIYRSIPTSNKVYISWIVKWDPTFDHNSTSEKLIYFNHGSTNYFMFEFLWRNETMYNIQSATGDPHLYANLMPQSQGQGVAPPQNGVWMEYEIYVDRTAGTVQWWTNGQLRASHTGRTIPAVSHIQIDATWGGGGDKQGISSRYTDHIFVAAGN